MKNKKVDFIWLAVSCLSFLIFSVSFMIMPFESASAEDGFSIAAHLSGLMFWISLLIGVISQTVLVSRRSRRNIVSRVRRIKDTQNIGMFCFFKNKLATVFDILYRFPYYFTFTICPVKILQSPAGTRASRYSFFTPRCSPVSVSVTSKP